MDVPRHRLVLAWSVSGVILPLALGGLAFGLGALGLQLLREILAAAALAVMPFWLLGWLALADPKNDLLWWGLVGAAFLLNGLMFALVGLLHRRIVAWPPVRKGATLALVLGASSGLAYLSLYFAG
jgi:hypothetical protein